MKRTFIGAAALAAMTAVDNIVNGIRSRENLWELNADQEYHEENSRAEAVTSAVS